MIEKEADGLEKIKFDYQRASQFISEHEMTYMSSLVKAAHEQLHTKTGAGNDFLGWIDLASQIDQEEYVRLKKAALKIQSDSDVLVVIGIGGSYLGARAAIEMLNHHFYNILESSERKTPQIFFVGNTISPTYTVELFDVLKNKNVSINVISKSGTTTEPAIAFRIFRAFLEEKYGKEFVQILKDDLLPSVNIKLEEAKKELENL